MSLQPSANSNAVKSFAQGKKLPLGTSRHPLDPLSPEEITAAAAACKERALELNLPELRFNSIGAKVGARGCDGV